MTDYVIDDVETDEDGVSVRLFDSGGIGAPDGSYDRYTAIFDAYNREHDVIDAWYLGMSEDPYHPQGFGQHGEGDVSGVLERDREISLADAPEPVRRCIEAELAAYAEAFASERTK